jgi:hypothetical protein
MKYLRFVRVVLLCISVTSCVEYHRLQQKKTMAGIRTAAVALEDVRAKNGHLTESDIRKAVASIYSGYDAWGTRLVCVTRPRANGDLSYLIISLGPDHLLNVAHASDYFDLQSRFKRPALAGDIVFCDGELVSDSFL